MAKKLDDVLDSVLNTGAIGVPVTADDVNRELYSKESYAWALDAFWTYEHMGDKMTRVKAGSAGRWALWQFAKNEPDKFIGQILPKAMALLEKAREKEGDDQVVVEAERKSLANLRQILADAVAELAGLE